MGGLPHHLLICSVPDGGVYFIPAPFNVFPSVLRVQNLKPVEVKDFQERYLLKMDTIVPTKLFHQKLWVRRTKKTSIEKG